MSALAASIAAAKRYAKRRVSAQPAAERRTAVAPPTTAPTVDASSATRTRLRPSAAVTAGATGSRPRRVPCAALAFAHALHEVVDRGLLALARRAVLVAVRDHQAVPLEVARARQRSLDHDADPLAEHLRRDAAALDVRTAPARSTTSNSTPEAPGPR